MADRRGERIREEAQANLARAYDRYAAELYRIALALLDNSTGAEALVESIFADLWRSPPAQVEGGDRSLRSWMVGEIALRGLAVVDSNPPRSRQRSS
ncbi:MAG: hypothetical protein WAM30_20795 [Candidatus Dormiibacterota bacterium]